MDSDQNPLPTLPLPDGGKQKKQTPDDLNLAINLVRKKIDNIFDSEPDSKEELTEIAKTQAPISMHQRYLQDLQKSGKSASEIHKLWHNYYDGLPESEKLSVWDEFYSANKNFRNKNLINTRNFINNLYKSGKSVHEVQTEWHQYYTNLPEKDKNEIWQAFYQKNKSLSPEYKPSEPKVIPQQFEKAEDFNEPDDDRSVLQIKSQIRKKIEEKTKKHQSLRSIGFGLIVGSLVILILLFGFFNDRFIAPFISPSRVADAQSIIINPATFNAGPTPEIIIPKINVQIPVIYNLPTSSTENDIENSLEDGVVHYPTTPYPGQLGNGAIFGHSSNNILNPGQYKFAFVLLHDLVPGDTFYLTYNSKVYVYQIYKKSVVPPTDTSVLNTQDKPATFSLITCDPPGTSINRLVVVGEQISPDPSTNAASSVNQNTAAKPAILPSNSPSLWSRVVKIF